MHAYIALAIIVAILLIAWCFAAQSIDTKRHRISSPVLAGTQLAMSASVNGMQTNQWVYTPGNTANGATGDLNYFTPWFGFSLTGLDYTTDYNKSGSLISSQGITIPYKGTLGPLSIHFYGDYTANVIQNAFIAEVLVSKFPGPDNFLSVGLKIPVNNVPKEPALPAVIDLTSIGSPVNVNPFDRFTLIVYNNINGLVSIELGFSLKYSFTV